MIKYPVKTEKEDVKAAGIGLTISTKKSIIICRNLNGMKLERAMSFLQEVINGKNNINGKHYTKTCMDIVKVLESAGKNAEFKGLETPVIKTICAEKGSRRIRMKRRRSFGRFFKNTNIKVVLKEGKKGVKK